MVFKSKFNQTNIFNKCKNSLFNIITVFENTRKYHFNEIIYLCLDQKDFAFNCVILRGYISIKFIFMLLKRKSTLNLWKQIED